MTPLDTTRTPSSIIVEANEANAASNIPVFLTAEKQHILIVGTGPMAMAKVALLSGSTARISVVGTGVNDALSAAGIENDRVIPLNRAFTEDDLTGKTLLYIAVDDELSEERLVRLATARGLQVNVVDKPAKSNFTTPAQFKRGSLTAAFSSGGEAPVFVRKLRSLLERLLPPSLGVLTTAAGRARGRVKTIIPDAIKRRLFWDQVFDDASRYSDLDEDAALTLLLDRARKYHTGQASTGLVQLVGAGPGDADLLTIKAHRALQEADVIVYDRLVSQDVLSLARRDAELVFVGKREGEHGVGQDGIHTILIDRALKGDRVVRLKGGDPLMFARAGEELEALRAHDITVEVVPGITAIAGIAAATQIPLTDREFSSALTLVTGQLKDGAYSEWAALAGKGRTLAVYMGVRTAGDIASGLIEAGTKASTPVAIVENGTRRSERRFYGNLSDLGTLVAENNVKSPALLLIGDVVSRAADFSTVAIEAELLAATA